MRFNIEQRHLTDSGGHPVSSATAAVSFHSIEAESASDAIVVGFSVRPERNAQELKSGALPFAQAASVGQHAKRRGLE